MAQLSGEDDWLSEAAVVNFGPVNSGGGAGVGGDDERRQERTAVLGEIDTESSPQYSQHS